MLATATMLRVIDEVEPHNPMEYKAQLLHVLRMDKVRTGSRSYLVSSSP